jgi:hypothetical protein
MDSAEWAAVAAIASAVSAVAALVVAWITWRTARAGAKSADFDSCLALVAQVGDALRKVRDAPADQKKFEINELMNLLEALAMLVNKGKIAPSTRLYTEHYLEEVWAWLNASPDMATLIGSSVTGPETFADLQKFAKRRKRRIRGLEKAYKERIPPVVQPNGQ